MTKRFAVVRFFLYMSLIFPLHVGEISAGVHKVLRAAGVVKLIFYNIHSSECKHCCVNVAPYDMAYQVKQR